MSRIQQDLSSTIDSNDQLSGMLRAAQRSGRQLNIGIIGAGFAGLRCADVLLQAGCKVTILEARHRVGGRVAQSSHLGSSELIVCRVLALVDLADRGMLS